MANIEMAVFYRLLNRSAEIAAQKDMHSGVVYVYTNLLAAPAEEFRQAYDAMTAAESNRSTEKRRFGEAVLVLDKHYKVARSVLLAFAPEIVLPDTLKAQRTDTDKVHAAGRLLEALTPFVGQAWADEMRTGAFGTLTKALQSEHTETLAAESAFAKVREERLAAFEPAYEQFLAFKRVVRDALGPKSKQYRRIHIRAKPNATETESETTRGSATPQ